MNKDKLTAACHKISKETGLNFNTVLTHYFLESILEKIANSDENQHFVFKGGFLLSNIVGIRQRSTVDMDFLIRNFLLSEANIKERFLKILENDGESAIEYEIKKIEATRNQDEYGGFRLSILCKLDNIRQVIPIDIATGDPITPKDIEYEYQSIFGNKTFQISAYNIETILAEKIQTLYQRGIFNTRNKDFYDLYILFHFKKNSINKTRLEQACINTFNHRNTEYHPDQILELLMTIEKDINMQKRWKSYQKKFPYVKDIDFGIIIKSIKSLIEYIK